MVNEYDKGDQVRITILTQAGSPLVGVTPNTRVFKYFPPGVDTEVVVDPGDIENPNTGDWQFVIDTTGFNAGELLYRGEFSGNYIGAQEGRFEIKESRFYPEII